MVPNGKRAMIGLKHFKIHWKVEHLPHNRWGKYLIFLKHQASVSFLPRTLSQFGSPCLFAGSWDGGQQPTGRKSQNEMMTPHSATHLPPKRLADIPPLQCGKASLCRWEFSLPAVPFKGLFFHKWKEYQMQSCAWLKIPYSACLECRQRANRLVLQRASTGQQQQHGGASNNSREANLVPTIPNRHQNSIFFLLLWLLTSKIY